MKVGDVVVANRPFTLHCGSGMYSHAIVVSLEPFKMVSEEGDMLWTKARRESVTPLCQAHPDIVRRCLERAAREL